MFFSRAGLYILTRDYYASILSYVNATASQNISLFLQTRFLSAATYMQADVMNLLRIEHCEHNSFEETILVTPQKKKKKKALCTGPALCEAYIVF